MAPRFKIGDRVAHRDLPQQCGRVEAVKADGSYIVRFAGGELRGHLAEEELVAYPEDEE
jgi:hypothetical protein